MTPLRSRANLIAWPIHLQWIALSFYPALL